MYTYIYFSKWYHVCFPKH